ncbi:MAG: hypothetical protein ABIP36_05105 [Acidimicrobiales bacterium]
MAQLQVGLPLRLIGYDRKATLALLTSTQDQLRRAETQRDELASATVNLERIGSQVADMLRTLADRAAELEGESAATAAEVVEGAQIEADQIRAQAAAVLASAEAQAHQLVETARHQQATIVERRGTALVSLQIALDQMGRLANTIDEIDLTAVEAPLASIPPPPGAASAPPATAPETLVLLPESAEPATAVEDPVAQPSTDGDPIAPVLARMAGWSPAP